MWPHLPSADTLLAERLKAGWAPRSSPVAGGPTVLGHARCLVEGGCGPLAEAARAAL
ncbi:MAG: hypothetical protein H6741_12775 [Alphaproteobacteria bacterium]|nr:hypothetical protein [Alphaproteobacteria bacterium]